IADASASAAAGAEAAGNSLTAAVGGQPGAIPGSRAFNFADLAGDQGGGTGFSVGDNPLADGSFSIEFWMRQPSIDAPTTVDWSQGIGILDASVEGPAADFGISLVESGGTSLAVGIGDPNPTLTQIADSQTEHSGTQGQNGWFYGYHDVTANGAYAATPGATDHFIPFLGGAGNGAWGDTNHWTGGNDNANGNWDFNPVGPSNGNAPWTIITPTVMHPNDSDPGPEHYAIRRYVSEVAGTLVVQGHAHNTSAAGDGTVAHVYHNGREVASFPTNGNRVDFDFGIEGVQVGDFIDLMVDTGPNPGPAADGSDSTEFVARIFQAEQSSLLSPTSVDDDQWHHVVAVFNQEASTGIYAESGGQVVVEAENFTRRTPHTDGSLWKVAPDEIEASDNIAGISNARGGKYVVAAPDANTPGGPATTTPAIEYDIEITTPGQYQLYVRAEADAPTGNADSFFVDIVQFKDGPGGALPDWYEIVPNPNDGNFDTNSWRGTGEEDANAGAVANDPLVWQISNPGVYTIRFTPREDGASLDSFVFQLASMPAPTGAGPAAQAPPARLELYIDGQMVAMSDVNGLNRVDPTNIRIGEILTNTAAQNIPYSGLLDELSLYPSALTPEQVEAHYSTGMALSGGRAGDDNPSAVLTIVNDDLIKYDFDAAEFRTPEGDTTNTTNVVTITRSGVTDVASSVDIVVRGGAIDPATPGIDLNGASVTVNFAPGETTRSVPIVIFGDLSVETDETVELSLARFAADATAAGQVIGPYLSDASTLHAYHFEEAAAALFFEDANIDNATDLDLDNFGAVSGAAGASRFDYDFGRAIELGTGRTQSRAAVGNVSSADLQGADGAFTYEALIRLDTIDPADYGTGGRQVLTVGGNQVQFRIRSNVAGDRLQLQFINGGGVAGGSDFAVDLPAAGDPNAPAVGRWFHVAIAYDGAANGDGSPARPATQTGTARLYFTRLENSIGVANQIGQTDNFLDTPAFANSQLVVGNRNGATENLPGAIDEVRISNRARGREEFLFAPSIGMPGSTQPTTTLVIENDDTITYDFTLANFEDLEQDAPHVSQVATITRQGDTSVMSMVDIILTPSGAKPATADVDYTNEVITVVFAAGETTKVVPIEILGDTILEPNETFDLSLGNFRVQRPLATAGQLYVDLSVDGFDTNTGVWDNRGSLGDFNALGGPVFVADVAGTGMPGISFNGAGDAFVGPATLSDLVGASDRSIEVWVYNPSLPNEDSMVSWGHRGGPDASNMSFNYGQGDPGGATHWGANAYDVGWDDDGPVNLSPAAGEWHHLVYVYDGGTSVRLYADGVLNTDFTLPDTLNTHAGDTINIAAQRGIAGLDPTGVNSNFFSGSIASVRVHGGTLTLGQIQQNFVRGMGGEFFDGGEAGTTQPTATFTILDDDVLKYDFAAPEYDIVEGDVPHTSNVVLINRSGDTSRASSVDVVLSAGTVDRMVSYANFDIGLAGQRVETGWNSVSGAAGNFPATTYTSQTGDSFTLAIDNLDAANQPAGQIDWRDRGDSTGASSLVRVGEDHIKNNAGIIRVTLDGLAAGEYEITSYHVDATFDQANPIRVLANTGSGFNDTGVTGNAGTVIPLNGLNTSNIEATSATFSVTADGTNPVVLLFDATAAADTELPLSGLAIQARQSTDAATLGVDVVAGPVRVDFAAGETQKALDLDIFGDLIEENDESFTLSFANFEADGLSSYAGQVIDDAPSMYFRFEETGTTAFASNGTVAGVLANAMGGVADGQTGAIAGEMSNNALHLDGTSGWLLVDQVLTPTNFGGDDNYSVELWFNQDAASNGRTMVGMTFDGTGNFGLLTEANSNDEIRYLHRNGGSDDLRPTGINSASEWHHLVVLRDGSEMRIYLDGAERASTNVNVGAFAADLQVAIGRLGPTIAQRFFNGLLDEVAFYNYALSDQQILDHFDAADSPALMAGMEGITQPTATVTIVDDDTLEYDFTTDRFEVTEGDDTHVTDVVRITRSGKTDVVSFVDVTLTAVGADPATPGVDLETGPITVRFAPGETEQIVPISIFGDLVLEADETVELSFSNFRVPTLPMLPADGLIANY
ncbi:MAG: hypothetical protein KDA42_13925, partial [Planctomycetales bacterium]|nr:hypothetical protein [Planctomycetales bacterium]